MFEEEEGRSLSGDEKFIIFLLMRCALPSFNAAITGACKILLTSRSSRYIRRQTMSAHDLILNYTGPHREPQENYSDVKSW